MSILLRPFISRRRHLPPSLPPSLPPPLFLPSSAGVLCERLKVTAELPSSGRSAARQEGSMRPCAVRSARLTPPETASVTWNGRIFQFGKRLEKKDCLLDQSGPIRLIFRLLFSRRTAA